ncbi:hypothetical protein ABIE65_001037 [Constrictibacter sp. MBR-5]|uniref:hypothetical protein n=1 Tax=Constrictibacter sp. MBR-5 TaxID=3156467 RepID=UPI00339ABF3F
MADDFDDAARNDAAHVNALAAVEAFGRMSPEEQRQFEAELVARARAEGWYPGSRTTH